MDDHINSRRLKLLIIVVGKTSEEYLKEGIDIFLKRISNYMHVSVDTVKSSSLKDKEKAMKEEESNIEARLNPGDFLVVLDEKGVELQSRQFAEKFTKWMNQGLGRIVFITGGAFGISDSLKKKSNFLFSVSKLTFTHQMVRLILAEQIYRAMTIIRNEGYHHD